MRPILRRSLWTLGGLAALLVAFHTVENFRGKPAGHPHGLELSLGFRDDGHGTPLVKPRLACGRARSPGPPAGRPLVDALPVPASAAPAASTQANTAEQGFLVTL